MSGDVVKLPAKNKSGNYPALSASQVTIARTIIRQLAQKKLSQIALAKAAGICLKRLCRIEMGKMTPNKATISKIENALKVT